MKAKEFLKNFKEKHGIEPGYIWRSYELLKLMDEYAYQIPKKLNGGIVNEANPVCHTCNGTGLVYVNESIGNTLCPDC